MAKQEILQNLKTHLERGYSAEAIEKSGLLKNLISLDVPEDLLTKLKEIGINLDSPRRYLELGKDNYIVSKTSSGSYCVLLPKTFVKDFNVKAITWRLDTQKGILIGIPSKV